jgi:hypothetical protein
VGPNVLQEQIQLLLLNILVLKFVLQTLLREQPVPGRCLQIPQLQDFNCGVLAAELVVAAVVAALLGVKMEPMLLL